MSKRLARRLFELCLACSALTACAPTVEGDWLEEVQLGDGRTITVQREVTWRESTPWGQAKRYLVRETTLAFAPSPTEIAITWEGFDEHLIVLDFDSVAREYVLVTQPGTCSRYQSVARPQPPYLVYRLRDDEEWVRVGFTAALVGKKANMLVYPDVASRRPIVTASRKAATQPGLPLQIRELVSTGDMSPC